MKKLAITAALSVGMVGAVQAQNADSVLAALNGAIPNLTATGGSLIAGDAGATAQNLSNTLNGLTTGLAAGTPLAPLAATGADLSNTLVGASTAITPTLTSLAAPLAAQGAPLASGFDSVSNVINGFVPVQDALPGLLATTSFASPAFGSAVTQELVSQLAAGNLNVVSEALGLVGQSGLPGLGDLSSVSGGGLPGLDALPLDALDPAILTDLLSGGLPALPSGGGLPALPGADALPLDALDPAILTDLLSGGLPALPGAGGLPGLDALPLDALDPAILTGLLSGGLPALPGLDALPLDALDPAILTGLLDGGLPALPTTPAL